MHHRFYLKAVFALCLSLIFSGPSFAAENHGLFSIEDFFQADSSSQDRNILTTRFRLDSTKLNSSGTLSFHFDGRERNSLGTKDYNPSIRRERVDVLNLEYSTPSLSLVMGRTWVKDLFIERVDGVNVVFRSDGKGLGLFGGAKPDPYTEAFNADFMTAGAYAFYSKEDLSGSMAVVHNAFKGAADRQYLYAQGSFYPKKELRLYGNVTVDRDQVSKNLSLTNAIFEASYRPDFTKSVSVGYSQFRAIRYFKSMTFTIDNSRQQIYYLSGTYRVLDKYNLYGRVERSSRLFNDITGQNKSAMNYQVGVSRDNIYRGVNMNLNLTLTDSYGSSTHEALSVDLSKYWESFEASVRGTYVHNAYTATDTTDNLWVFGVSGTYFVKKGWNVSGSYEFENGSTYTTNRLMTRLSYKF
ncbi:MAG: hypothetical protein HY893_00645 [Deltaproteobacteria bacterium]|nr:hypothetical protein [Deltaproteobacteria bacterium]